MTSTSRRDVMSSTSRREVMSSTSRRGEFPSSIDSIRKSIQRTSFTVERETGQFISECSGKVGKTDSWVKFVEAACTKAGKEPSSLKSLKDLKRLLARAKDEEAEYSDEYVELRKMMKRGKLFEYIAFTLRSDLVNAYDSQLEKYCLSFYLEAKEEELKAVQEYEQTIGVCRREIKDRMELFDRLLDEADKYKDSIVQYITNYGFVVGRMVEVCQALAGVCTPIKKWLVADADYPRRIQEEIASYTRRKIDLQDVIKEKEEERGRHAKRLRKIANKTVTLERQLKRYKEEHRFYKRREADIQDRYVRGEAELARKKNDLDEVRGRLKSRRHQTTSMNVYMGGMAETIRIEVQTTERKLEQMETQMSELHQDQDRVQKDIDRLTDEIRESELNHEAAKERSVKCDDDLKFINEDIQKQAAKIAALKNIRELKLHSDTVKKIYHYGYNPELILEAKDELQEAFRVTAEDIGKDWMALYQRLPFDPPRDSRQRQRDLEVIDLSHRRLDAGYQLLASKALEKWRRQSDRSTFEDLLLTLRRMKKHKTIEKIRRQVLMTNSDPQ